MSGHFLIVEARFYADIAEAQLAGAKAALSASGASFEHVSVPGALEIPAIIAMAAKTGQFSGFIALGSVIRGETTHYDYVCNEVMRGINDLAINQHLAIGNSVLTCENKEQAIARADIKQKNNITTILGGGQSAFPYI